MRPDHPDSRLSIFRSVKAQRYIFSGCALLLLALVAKDVVTPFTGVVIGLAIAALLGPYWWFDASEQEIRETPAVPAQDGIDNAVASIVEAMPLAALMIDRDGHVVTLNPKAIDLAPTLRRGEPVTFVLRMPAVVDAVKRAIATGEIQRAEFSDRVPIDRWFEAQVTPTPLVAANGRSLFLITLHDLTPLRRVEEMRVDFVANASHELRTPLASLSGFIDTLQGPARNDPVARDRFLGIMRAQADRMARVIQDLLSLSRIELNAHIRPDGAVDIVGAVRHVADGLQVLARERDVEITIDGPDTLSVVGEADELLRVFENLIENALKYGAAGKRVVVTIKQEANEAKVAVRDFGPGIAPEHLPRLTERFYRVDVSHSRAEGGTGLGLALVKHVINRHRGRLTIDSVVGTGSNFSVFLPVSAQVVAPNSSAKPAA